MIRMGRSLGHSLAHELLADRMQASNMQQVAMYFFTQFYCRSFLNSLAY